MRTTQYFDILGNMKSKDAILALSALAHEGRLSAWRLLVKAGPKGMPAGEIAQRLRTPPSSLSSNLLLLANAGLVTSERDGRSIIYRVDFNAMQRLLGFLVRDCCNGAPEVSAPLAAVLSTCGADNCRR